MATDLEKKLKDVRELIAKKLAEVKELRKLEKAYYIADKLEKKSQGKEAPGADTGAKETEQ